MLAKCFRVKRIKLIRLTLYLCIKFIRMSIQTFKEKVKGFISRIPTDRQKEALRGWLRDLRHSKPPLWLPYWLCSSRHSSCRKGSTRLHNQEGNARICRFRLYDSRRGILHLVFGSPFFVGASLHNVGLLLSLALQKASYS